MTTTDQLVLVADGPDRARWSDYDADFTPRGVIRQGLQALSHLDRRGRLVARAREPGSIWDPSAGAGGFGLEAKLAFPLAMRVATEVRAEEREHLERHYHYVAIADFAAGWPVEHPSVPAWIVTNPPWSLAMALVQRCRPLLERGSMLALFGPVSWGSSYEPADGLEVMQELPPIAELRVPGRIKFRRGINPRTGTKYTADHRKCAWWVWGPASTKPRSSARTYAIASSWSTYVLPQLPEADREWLVRPGTEEE